MIDASSWTSVSYQSHAFFLDFDGTLVELVARPDLVRASPELVGQLEQLQNLTNGAIAIVTGRELAVVDAALAPVRLAGAGIHGLEMRLTAQDEIWRMSDGGPLEQLRGMATAWVLAQPGLMLEDKGLALAFHYRARPELGPAVTAYVEGLASTHPGRLTVQHGKMVAELREAGPQKGDALAMLMRGIDFAGRIPVMFGDDITDEGAFAAAQGLGGIGVLVGAAAHRSFAAARVGSPDEVRRMIGRLARRESVPLRLAPTREEQDGP
jgi:trehalose 6-phosphate phosphatase